MVYALIFTSAKSVPYLLHSRGRLTEGPKSGILSSSQLKTKETLRYHAMTLKTTWDFHMTVAHTFMPKVANLSKPHIYEPVNINFPYGRSE